MAKTFSVSVRLQRVTTETAHVSVALSDELFQLNPEGSGTNTIDPEKLIAAAIELGRHPATHWNVEGEVVITPHPIQTPPHRIGAGERLGTDIHFSGKALTFIGTLADYFWIADNPTL